jgi:septum formation protein
MRLILASSSLRRKEILEAHGETPIVIPSEIKEILPEGRLFSPAETAMYLAEQKAESVAERLASGAYGAMLQDESGTDFRVLAVDTIVYKDRIIGKPVDESDALSILRSLKNALHYVISGVCLIELGQTENERLSLQRKQVFYDSTSVTFGDYSDDEILEYIRSNPPYDKSGSYAIQSSWGVHVTSVIGSIENVIGLPWEKIEARISQ